MVVKPSISGGGYRTARYEAHERDAARAHVRELVGSGHTAMVQPYEPRVDDDGETGLVYVGGAFSHAIHKDPMIRRGVGPTDSLIANQVVTAAAATTGPARRGGPRPGGGGGPPRPRHATPASTWWRPSRRGPPCSSSSCSTRCSSSRSIPGSAASFARVLAGSLRTG